VLEAPLRVKEFRLSQHSGRRARFPAADGVRRSLRFLSEDGTASILSKRRALLQKGLAGGEDGRPGRNLLRRGKRQRILPAKVTFELRRDDLVVIETPGGGGWGPAETPRD